MDRLAQMIQVGQSETFPKLLFISNRLKIERLVQRGRQKTRDKGDSRSDGEVEKLGYQQVRRRNISMISPGSRSPRIEEHDETDYTNGSTPSGRRPSWFSPWPKYGSQDGTHSPVRSPNDVNGVEAPYGRPGEARGALGEGREGRRGSRLEELSRQGSVIFGFDDSDDSTAPSEYQEVNGGEERYTGSTGSELGESDAYSGGEDGSEPVEFVEGGGKALL